MPSVVGKLPTSSGIHRDDKHTEKEDAVSKTIVVAKPLVCVENDLLEVPMTQSERSGSHR